LKSGSHKNVTGREIGHLRIRPALSERTEDTHRTKSRPKAQLSGPVVALALLHLHLHHDGFLNQHETEHALQKRKPTLHPMEKDK
jgi:hypothetical protein